MRCCLGECEFNLSERVPPPRYREDLIRKEQAIFLLSTINCHSLVSPVQLSLIFSTFFRKAKMRFTAVSIAALAATAAAAPIEKRQDLSSLLGT